MKKPTIFIVACLSISCLSQYPDLGEAPVGGGSEVEVHFCAVSAHPSASTRSVKDVDEDKIENLNIYVYRDGMLNDEVYCEGDEASLSLVDGATYKAYAIANAGEVHAPALEKDLGSIVISSDRIPMCLREGESFTCTATKDEVELRLTRLVARYNLVFDNSLVNCNYQITSASIMQEASSVSPFLGTSAASDTRNGDMASPADIDLLNSGEVVSFYVLENCQGVLLKGNDDPWMKVPDSIPGKSSLCTYLHIEGVWTTPGAQADMSVNLYLGADNCSDFNVVRNSNITITLSISDSGTLKSSWKIEMDELEDNRSLSFTFAEEFVYQEMDWMEMHLEVTPSDVTYYAELLDFDASETVAEVKIEAGKLYARTQYNGLLTFKGTLKVTTWDGRLTASVPLNVKYIPTELTEYECHLPEYYGEYGYVRFTKADPSHVYDFITKGWTCSMGPNRDDNHEYYYDSLNDIEYHAFYYEKTIYFRVKSVSKFSVFLDLKREKSEKRLVINPIIYPFIRFEDDMVLTDSGNRYYDSDKDLYYDECVKLYLSDRNEFPLDMKWFATPEDILDLTEKSYAPEIKFKAFKELYGLPVITCTGGEHFGYELRSVNDEGMALAANENCFGIIHAWGIEDSSLFPDSAGFAASFTTDTGYEANASCKVTQVATFPSQRFLGQIYNYSLAPGSIKSNVKTLDFRQSKYLEPNLSFVDWSVKHLVGSLRKTPTVEDYNNAISDVFSNAISVEGKKMTFAPLDSDHFVGCGGMILMGHTVNPHTGVDVVGFYTIDIVLYATMGFQVDVLSDGSLGCSIVPFCDYSTKDLASLWNDNMVPDIRFYSYALAADIPFRMPTSANDNVFTIPGSYPSELGSLLYELRESKDMFTFDFIYAGKTTQSLDLSRSGFSLISGKTALSDGRYGYYHLIRQYDMANYSYGPNFYGLENYILEAALCSMDKL